MPLKAERHRPKRVSLLALETYLAHVIDGFSMRHLAREEGSQPSTILRRIRRVEDARDCPDFEAFTLRQESARRAGGGINPDPRFVRCRDQGTSPQTDIKARFQKLVAPRLVDGNQCPARK